MSKSTYCADIIVADFKIRLSTAESHILYALHENIKVIPPHDTADFFVELKSFSSSSTIDSLSNNFTCRLNGEDAYIGFYSNIRRKALFLFHDQGEIAVSIGNALRQLVFLLAREHDFLIMHAASILLENGVGILLCGKSGNGKSTAASLLSDLLIISDDLTIISGRRTNPILWAMPGSKGDLFIKNRGFPLAAVYLLVKSEEEKIESISPAIAMAGCFSFYGIDENDVYSTSHKMELLKKLIHKIPAFNIYFRKTTNLHNLIHGNIMLE